MTSTSPTRAQYSEFHGRRIVVTGLIAALLSSIAVLLVTTLGKSLGASQVQQLTTGPLLSLTIIGVAVGTAVWAVVCRRATDPAATLKRLVPAVLVLSFIPDFALGASGTEWSAVTTLICAHITVFAVTIPLLLRRLPATPSHGQSLTGADLAG